VNEHEIEPIRGLPELLPRGEHILWQGAPHWMSLAMRALHVRLVLGYFALLFLWSVYAAVAEGSSLAAATLTALRLAPVALAAAGILSLYAWLVRRTTIYTITNRRVVMRFGIALPMTLNVPYAIVGSAALKAYGDGTGDIPLELKDTDRVAYFALWPHARPWWLAKPQPMLRAVPNARAVADILGDALRQTQPSGASPSKPRPEAARLEPATPHGAEAAAA
jgi:hypothetical protein